MKHSVLFLPYFQTESLKGEIFFTAYAKHMKSPKAKD